METFWLELIGVLFMLLLVGFFSAAEVSVLSTRKSRMQELAEAEKFALRSRAAKRMDEYLRSHTMVPMCPHCDGAILPDDVVNGLGQKSKSIEIAARKRQEQKP